MQVLEAKRMTAMPSICAVALAGLFSILFDVITLLFGDLGLELSPGFHRGPDD